MKKKNVQSVAGVSTSPIAKLGRNEPVIMTVLMKICTTLQCDIGDIMETISDKPKRP
jgi:DNA-binding Xre family transcriptional regulator